MDEDEELPQCDSCGCDTWPHELHRVNTGERWCEACIAEYGPPAMEATG